MTATKALTTLATTLLLAACTSESYDSGDGTYSYLRADFAMLHASTDLNVDYFTTDDDTRLYVAEPFTKTWITTPDTTYRALVYYNVPKTGSTTTTVSVVSTSYIYVLTPIAAENFDTIRTDPVTFESAWLSANGIYVNIGFYIKTGTSDDDDAQQTIGIVDDGIETLDDGTTQRCLRLYHDQGDVPQYYSSRRYLSVRADNIAADAVKITVEDYDGTAERTITL